MSAKQAVIAFIAVLSTRTEVLNHFLGNVP